MSRWLSIDYGEKRIGVAVTDPLKIIISPLTTIENKSDDYVFDELINIFDTQKIERIILGLPISIDGEDTAKTKEVREFYGKLSKKTDLPIFLWDERFSTYEANIFLKQKGLSWKESRNYVDKIAAAVILKNYLENNRY
jgi:putative Holliday junction resolvase